MENKRLILALDTDNIDSAKELVDRFSSQISHFKIGYELFFNTGFECIEYIAKKEGKIMLDLKLLDIPNTVDKTIKSIVKRNLPISFLTVHGFSQTISQAVESAKDSDIQILGVTVLTSFSEEETEEYGGGDNIEDIVVYRAKNILQQGGHGVVASAREAKRLREELGNDFIIATPGIRIDDNVSDQKRVTTPKEAIENGADYIIMGRGVIESEDPEKTINNILTSF